MTVTISSRLTLPDRTSQQQVERYLLPRDNGRYTVDDVKWIISQYLTQAPLLLLDPLIVIAQMCWETGHLSSAWAARPYCNPAGIGVTSPGGPGVAPGVNFNSWHNSIPAHLGRLVAYAVPVTERTPAQQSAVQVALKWRALPAERQGKALTLSGLATTWAADPTYAVKIAGLANNILKA